MGFGGAEKESSVHYDRNTKHAFKAYRAPQVKQLTPEAALAKLGAQSSAGEDSAQEFLKRATELIGRRR
jgi:hypothetical protein